MPKFGYFERSGLDPDSIPLRVKAMQRLGVPYTNEPYLGTRANAEAQAKSIAANIVSQSQNPELQSLKRREVIALIAYLQRIGVD